MAAASTTKISWRLQEFEAHSRTVSCLSLGKSSGRLLVTGGEDCRVNIWAVNKANCVMSLTGHKNPVECVQFNVSEEQVVAGSQSGSIRVWDLEAAKILRTLMGHKANVSSLSFHPFGNFLASSSTDTSIKLWDVRRKGYVFRYKGHTEAVRSLAFSPDGKWLASASDDFTVKLWDLFQGKTITEFKSHSAAVNVVQFHPTEYLLASGSADRSIKLWDLEKFTMVGSLEGDTSAVRCLLFSPDGSCLYSGGSDSLRVFGWEPDRCFDVVPVGWGKVSDLAVCNQQLIGVSHQLSSVSSYLVDLKRVKKSGGAVIQGIIQDNKPLTDPAEPRGTPLRRNYDRPTTTCSANRFTQGRRSQSEDEAEDKQPSAEIHNVDDYREIFQPKHAICRWSRERRLQHSHAFPLAANPAPPSQPAPPAQVAPPKAQQQVRVIPSSRNEPLGLNVADFLPVTNHQGGALNDDDALSQMSKGHDTMCVMLSSRRKNLQTVRSVWAREDVKSALDAAGSMNDLSIMVDVLNILNLHPSLWKLDLCTLVLPQIDKLLQSKYESYMHTGSTSLKLIIKHFWALISDTLKASPAVGVDITREERHQKCRECCRYLQNLNNVVKNRAGQVGRHGSTFKELQLLMAPLDDAL
uniref:Katanin p80 WD40 repeat-containing subunit B1 n=1 Tax=Fundulus heteroclitus TaxID=8078 RepID=A0A3Q2Q477_FUNHE